VPEPTRTKPRHPGEVLFTHFLKPNGTTVSEAAARMGLPAQSVEELVAGVRDVTPETALLLAEFTRTSAEFWLRLQEAMDVYHAQRRVSPTA